MKTFADGVTCPDRGQHPRYAEWDATERWKKFQHLSLGEYTRRCVEDFNQWLKDNPVTTTDNKDCSQSESKESNRLTGDRIFRLTMEAMMDDVYWEYPECKGHTREWFEGWLVAARKAADLIDEQNGEKA